MTRTSRVSLGVLAGGLVLSLAAALAPSCSDPNRPDPVLPGLGSPVVSDQAVPSSPASPPQIVQDADTVVDSLTPQPQP